MSYHFVRDLLLSAAVLGLAGCATHSEPPAKTVKLAFVKHLTGHPSLHLHWPKNHHTLIYEMLIHSHVEKCVPTRKPDVRACSVYIKVHGHPSLGHRGVIDMIKEGAQWHLLWN